MHNYGDGGIGWGGWFVMVATMVVFWGAIAWVVVTLIRQNGLRSHPRPTGTEPMRILDERSLAVKSTRPSSNVAGSYSEAAHERVGTASTRCPRVRGAAGRCPRGWVGHAHRRCREPQDDVS